MKTLILMLALICAVPMAATAADLPVKKSNSGICHAPGSTYYDRTRNYVPYPNMSACLNSGGRMPKR